MQQHFLRLTRRAIAGELDAWDADQTGGLALVQLFDQFTDSRTVEVDSRHQDVIARFQQFPHLNSASGLVSSAEELAFLQTPGSRF